MEIQKKFPKAEAVAGTIPRAQKYKYRGIKTEDCSIQSFVCSFENFIVVTNTLEQLTLLARVFDKKETNLASGGNDFFSKGKKSFGSVLGSQIR